MSDFEFYPLAIIFAIAVVSFVCFPWTPSTWGALGIAACAGWVAWRIRNS